MRKVMCGIIVIMLLLCVGCAKETDKNRDAEDTFKSTVEDYVEFTDTEYWEYFDEAEKHVYKYAGMPEAFMLSKASAGYDDLKFRINDKNIQIKTVFYGDGTEHKCIIEMQRRDFELLFLQIDGKTVYEK